MLIEIVFSAKNRVLCPLYTGTHFLASECRRQVECAGTREETIEKVHDVVVRPGIEKHLAVESSGKFKSNIVVNIVFHSQTGL